MNFKNLQDDFSVRYNTKTKPYCTFSGTPLFLLGDISFSDCGHSLISAISAGTALSISFEGTDFSIQQTHDNTVFSSEKKNLLTYSEKNYATPIFHAISYLNSHFKNDSEGLMLLYEHNTNSKGFYNYLSPLISAFLLLFPGYTLTDALTALSSLNLSKKEYFSLLTTLSQSKGHITLADNLSLLTKNYLLPLDDSKIVIIKTDSKPKKIFTDFSPVADPDELSKEQRRILSFFIKEEERILKYPEIKDFSEFHNLINESCEDLLPLIDTPAISLLIDIIRKTPALSSRPIANSSSVFTIVPDSEIDSFIGFAEKEYEKKAGYKPTFYITDTVASGIKSGLIH